MTRFTQISWFYRHCKTPFLHAYNKPNIRIAKNTIIETKAETGKAKNTTAQGNMKTTSTAKIKKNKANK
jgi:hypothetical protein